MVKKANRLDMLLTDEQAELLDRLVMKKAIPKTAVVNLAIKEMGDRDLEPLNAKKRPSPKA